MNTLETNKSVPIEGELKSNPATVPVVVKEKTWADYKSDEYILVSNPNLLLNVYHKRIVEPRYPFMDLKVDQGVFIPVEKNGTSVKLLDDVHKSITTIRGRFGLVEYDEFGDEVIETVMVKSRQRNPDGSYKLDGNDNFTYTANTVQRPALIYGGASFLVRNVLKDNELSSGQKAPADGVLVIRTY